MGLAIDSGTRPTDSDRGESLCIVVKGLIASSVRMVHVHTGMCTNAYIVAVQCGVLYT